MKQTREVIVELLSQLDGNREAREYLRRFSSVDSEQFAVVKVGGGVLVDELEELASALAFLRHVGLFPIVIHGAGPQLNQALQAAGVESEFIDNKRVTSPEVMKVARPIIYQQSQDLVDSLERRGVRARMIQHGVFECGYLDKQRYGLVGKVDHVHCAAIHRAIAAGSLPIVGCFGESSSGQVLNVNADMAAHALVSAIEPHKVVFLTATGGLLDDAGKVISAINLATDYQHLIEADWVHSGMQLKLEQIKKLLDELPLSASVSITSARRLTRELFTHRGSGTLIRRGETFATHDQITAPQQAPLAALLGKCFNRQLRVDYFERLTLDRLIWSSSHRAAAIITRDEAGHAYMDKFAVTPAAQGEGLGAALWQQVRNRYPTLYWRSRSDNPINGWYFRQADVSVREGPWHVFGVGHSDLAELSAAAKRAATAPESWLPRKEPIHG